ncbi:MAG: pentapeptide repeat-containing protein [Archangium sp.]
MDPELLAKLTAGRPTMSAEEWANALAEHETFVRHVRPGWGQRWQVLEVAGLPLAVWEGRTSEHGKQLNLNLGNLTGLTLDFAHLEAAAMPGVMAVGVSFRQANLRLALLTDARLDGCDLSMSRLDMTDFSRASLRGANFKKAVVTDTDFENADLRDCDFTGASFKKPKLKGAKLDGAKGLPPESEWG